MKLTKTSKSDDNKRVERGVYPRVLIPSDKPTRLDRQQATQFINLRMREDGHK